MPRTIHKARELPIRAVVIFCDGDSKTCAHQCEDDANDWIDRMLYRFGNHVVATDVFPNTN